MIHKLATGPITLTVARVELGIEGTFGVQAAIYGTGDEVVYISEMTALRQIERLNHTPQSLVGHTVHLEQIKKDGKTFTNLNLVGAGLSALSTATRSVATAPVAHAPAPKMTVSEAAALYAECVDAAMMTLGAKLETAELGVSDMAIQAAAATLFIRMSK
jgi:hypothetical protein